MAGKMNLARATVLRQIAAIRGITEKPVNDALVTIKSNLDVMAGLGDPLDKALTLRDLYNGGMVSVFTSGRYVSNSSSSGGLFQPTNPAIPTTVPPAPTGLATSAGFSAIYLTWNAPVYTGHSYTEIWRASVDNVGVATRIGTQSGTIGIYADAVGFTGAAYYYWVRYVSVSNTPGPYNGVPGTFASTSFIGTSDLGPLIITAAKIANGSVDLGGTKITGLLGNTNLAQITDTTKIADGLVGNTKLANLAVDAAKLADSAVTATKIANLAVGTAAIQTAAITTALIANLAVGGAQIADAAITSAKIGSLAVGTAAIQDGAITNAKIGSLAADKITAGTITAAITITAPTINSGAINGTVITGGILQTAASGDRFVVSQASGNAQFIGNRGDGVVQPVATIGYSGGGISILNLGLSATCLRPMMYAENAFTTMIIGAAGNYGGIGKTSLYLRSVISGTQEEAGLRSVLTTPNVWQAAVRGESDSYGLGLEGISSDLGAQLRLQPGAVSVPTHGCIVGSVYMSATREMSINKDGGVTWGRVIDTRASMTDWSYVALPGGGRWTPATPGIYSFVCTNQAIKIEIYSGGVWKTASSGVSSGEFYTNGINTRIYNFNATAADLFGAGVFQ